MTRHRPGRLLLCALLLVSPSAGSSLAQTATAAAAGAAQVRPPPVLSVRAPAGAGTEHVTTFTARLSVVDVQVSAAAAGSATEADLNAARRTFTGLTGSRTRTGKVFSRVVGRRPDGSVSLVTTLIQSRPAFTFRLSQDLSPAGQGSRLTLTSADPQLDHALSALDDPDILALAADYGAAFLYGAPLVPGQSSTTVAAADLQTLLSDLLGPSLSGPLEQAVSELLTVTTTATYRGTGPRGEFLFGTRAAAGPWTLRGAGGPQRPAVSAELISLSASGSASYRRDGLPDTAESRQQTRLNMTLRRGGVQVRLILNLDQTASLKPR
ncbi:hypothetical protein [Deinococcus sp. Leaf326]|uniref:hypothetical protein n=1 Tax=Deinococcus sp. Leaf326 TaxID=1736338 RepID=UPI0006F21325|nr:hypothetical protein [Deinococcus sp. Leaf326]KQR15670.1 hypothetical protein ASF71_08565 [Deinococcus sp. Leaf326]